MTPQQEKPEFDAFSADYAHLIRDPIREKFADSNRFFVERKLDVIREFCSRVRIDMHGLKWLDAGCGQGDLLRAGRPYFKSAAGCDPSEGMLRSCSGLDVKRQTSQDDLPFDNASFDFITAVCVYHHIAEPRRLHFTSEVMRLLAPGGIACVVEHNPLNPITQLIVSRTPVDADARLLRAGQTRSLLERSGGRILETSYFLLFPERIYKYFAFIENGLSRVPIGGQYCVFAKMGS